ncbi:hypothetical protein J3454_06640 [Erythrobacter sp. NFXS35]|uniref:hypothetical protein n=1 Tax=Erythrobacter sp. NFXS35 TaxID=2818436 RepID=UPI0032DEF435
MMKFISSLALHSANAVLVLAATSACMNPGTSGYYGPQVASPPPPEMGQAQAGFDPTGNWCFESGSNKNYMSYTGGSMTVTPSSGRSATYIQIGERLFRDADGPGTYEFVANNHAIWRSNTSSKQLIHLWSCH